MLFSHLSFCLLAALPGAPSTRTPIGASQVQEAGEEAAQAPQAADSVGNTAGESDGETPAVARDSRAQEPAWRTATAWLLGQQSNLSASLDRAHATLVARANEENRRLLPRLEPTPPRPRATGYGLLPKIVTSSTPSMARPWQRTYSLAELPDAFARDFVDAALLARTADQGELDEQVAEFERLRTRLRRLDEHITYHEWWQVAIVDDPEFFAQRNEVIALVRRWNRTRQDDPLRQTLGIEVQSRVAPFKLTPGLEMVGSEKAGWTLPVVVHTDITDAAFHRELERAVSDVWNASAAFVQAQLSIALTLEVHALDELYTDGTPPVPGQPIDMDEHLAHFPSGALVVTTGARSTHARASRYLQLGTQDLPLITLAHEFGHLLGFADAYLRGYDGSPNDPYGAILVEWSGLISDLMGNSKGGPVTPRLADQLFRAYRPEQSW